MKIVKLNGAKFGNNTLYKMVSGYAIQDKDGFIAFTCDRDKYGILTPYSPKGGKKALQSIIDAGGFIGFYGMEYVKEME